MRCQTCSDRAYVAKVSFPRFSAAIRSTQSATGILYITTIFVLFGELAALVMTSRGPTG